MQRLKLLRNHFSQANPPKLTKPLDELFVDSWSYLEMDEFLTTQGKDLRDKVKTFT